MFQLETDHPEPPALWNHIQVRYNRTRKKPRIMEMVRELILRSGSLPIHLNFSGVIWICHWSTYFVADPLGVITSISNRLGPLLLDLPRSRPVVKRFLQLPPGLLASLETSRLWVDEQEEERLGGTTHFINNSDITVFENARSLRSIEPSTHAIPWGIRIMMPTFHAPWGQVTTLKLRAAVARNDP